MLNHIAGFMTTMLPEGTVEQMQAMSTSLTDSPHLYAAAEQVQSTMEPATFSVPVKQIKAPYDKYASLRSTRSYKPEKEQTLSSMLFGAEAPSSDFDFQIDQVIAKQRSPHMLRSHASKSLQSIDGTMWSGIVYMGSEQTVFDVIFDNSSDWLSLSGSGCEGCTGKMYDPATSTLSKQVGVDYSERKYGATSMKGTEWTDEVCVTKKACIKDFEFFLAKEMKGHKESHDGIFGLARNHPYYLAKEEGLNRGPSYMMALENAGLISENSFSFYLAKFGEDSHLDFGAPRKDRMRNHEELQWIDLNQDFFWSSNCKGFAINQTSNSWSWGSIDGAQETVQDNAVYSMFDTGASAIIFPSDYFTQFLGELYGQMEGNEYALAEGYVVTKCYADFPPVHFLFGDRWVSVYPDEYVVDISENQDRSDCVLLFTEGDQAFFVMGLPLYMDYYTIHDDKNNRIGFAPHATSDKAPLEKGEQPNRAFASQNPPEKEMSIWSWVITIVIILVFVGGWLMIIRSKVRDDRDSRDGGRRSNDPNDSEDDDDNECPWVLWIIAGVTTAAFAFVMIWWFLPWINQAIAPDVKASRKQEGVITSYGAYLSLGGMLFGYALSKKQKTTDSARA